MHKYQNRISKENFQTSRSSNFKHDLTRRQDVNILLVRTVHEQTELSLKPRRALAGIEFSFHEREKEGMNRVWKIASNSHSRPIILRIGQRISPIIHLLSHNLLSRIISFYPIRSSPGWNSHCLLPILSISRPTNGFAFFRKFSPPTCRQDRFYEYHET